MRPAVLLCTGIEVNHLSVIDTLITDRTALDVDELYNLLSQGQNPSAAHKGAYNASDLNRVGDAVSYLTQRLQNIGISVTTEPKTNWTGVDIPTQSQIEKYLDNIWSMWAAIMAYRPDIKLPEEMRFLDYSGANQIEELLKQTDLMVTRIELSYRQYSGRQISGVNCLP